MKKIILILAIALSTNPMNTYAQIFTTDVDFHTPFDSAYIVGLGMVDSFDISNSQGFQSGQFVLCANSVFTFIGNQSSSGPAFYLFPGATLILKDTYFYPTVYMSDMAILDAKGGNQNIICYRESSSTLQDTANVNWLTDSVVSSMNFTFTNWPNASQPCSVSPPQSVKMIPTLGVNIFMQNRVLHYTLENESSTDVNVYDFQGRKLLNRNIKGSGYLSLDNFAAGVYIVHFKRDERLAKRKIILD